MDKLARKMILDRIDAELKEIPHKFGVEDIKISFTVDIITKKIDE